MLKRTTQLLILITLLPLTGCFHFSDCISMTVKLPNGEEHTGYGLRENVITAHVGKPIDVVVARFVTRGSSNPKEFSVDGFQILSEPAGLAEFDAATSTIQFDAPGEVLIWATANLGPTDYHVDRTESNQKLQSPGLRFRVEHCRRLH